MRAVVDWVFLWRGGNVILSAVCFVLLLADAWQRRRAHLRARFYWEAVALLLISIGWASAEAMFQAPSAEEWSPVRTAVVSVALVYFLMSTLGSWRLTRRMDREDPEGRAGRWK